MRCVRVDQVPLQEPKSATNVPAWALPVSWGNALPGMAANPTRLYSVLSRVARCGGSCSHQRTAPKIVGGKPPPSPHEENVFSFVSRVPWAQKPALAIRCAIASLGVIPD